MRPTEVLREPPWCARTMHVMDFLLAVPKVGQVRANQCLSRNAISPSKTLGGMTDRQRNVLIDVLT